ncbi:MAG: rRNA maturation RNase YbeY [Planctomycetales bacterium]|nr:rRNA maturation RNase YbeY [Planctomycetales bacterium]
MPDSAFEIDVSNRQSALAFDENRVQAAVLRALAIEQVASAVLSISIVDNSAIHKINRDHLQHDYPTDVISFQLDFVSAGDLQCDDEVENDDEDLLDEDYSEDDAGFDPDSVDVTECLLFTEGRAAGAAIEGEIIASAEMAVSMATDGEWSAEAELILYIVHGLLHICGYDDLTPEEKCIMRARERAILSELGLTAIYAEDAEEDRY